MTQFCRSCLAFLLKFFNFLQTFAGIFIFIYSLWLLNLWHRHGSPLDVDHLPAPWFVCATMGVGILLCLIAFTGHVAAEAINGCCLCFFAVLNSTLIMLEASLAGVVILNKHWEEDLPYDSTGELKKLREFIEDNMDICKWGAASLVGVQAISLLLAVVIRAMLPTRRVDYDSDEDFVVIRRPLLNPQGGTAYCTNSIDNKGLHSDIWSSRMRQKYGLNQNEYTYNAADPKTSVP
ncbi:tetraspanin-20 isoform X1 [Canna indica]|uniref:Tetraspanin-20 isoform X1 n=1 Tax=Canna indica TaxID=4628 RepID=A0AAQ3JVZ0_9LILI|nr:tetraspanin-20 isoform X1 [Canna indica]